MKPCKCCGKLISKRKRNPSRPIVYCSAKCQNKYQSDQIIKRWKAGKFHGTRGKQLQLASTVRRYIIDKNGHKCSKCGWAKKHPLSGKVPIQVHHIDGNPLNTKESNLQVLCPNCHSLTPNWGAGNKGFGRDVVARKLTLGKG